MLPEPLRRQVVALRTMLLGIAGAHFLIALLWWWLVKVEPPPELRDTMAANHPLVRVAGIAWLLFLFHMLLRRANWARILLLIGAFWNLAVPLFSIYLGWKLLGPGMKVFKQHPALGLFSLVLVSNVLSVVTGVVTVRLLLRRDVAAFYGGREPAGGFATLGRPSLDVPLFLAALLFGAACIYRSGVSWSGQGEAFKIQLLLTADFVDQLAYLLANLVLVSGALIVSLLPTRQRVRGLILGALLGAWFLMDVSIPFLFEGFYAKFPKPFKLRLYFAFCSLGWHGLVWLLGAVAYTSRKSRSYPVLALLVAAAMLVAAAVLLRVAVFPMKEHFQQGRQFRMLALPALAGFSLLVLFRGAWVRVY